MINIFIIYRMQLFSNRGRCIHQKYFNNILVKLLLSDINGLALRYSENVCSLSSLIVLQHMFFSGEESAQLETWQAQHDANYIQTTSVLWLGYKSGKNVTFK